MRPTTTPRSIIPRIVLDKDAEFAAAGTDRTHIFTASYVYELPFAREATGGWRKGLLRGWQIAGITRIESGPAARIQVPNCNFGGWCIPESAAAESGRRPRGWRPDRSALVQPRSVRTAAGTRVWQRARRAVPPARPSPVGLRRVEERESRWHEASAVQGRPDQRFQSDPVPGCRILCVSATTTCDPRVGFGKVTSTRPPREIQLGIDSTGDEAISPCLVRVAASLLGFAALLSPLPSVITAQTAGVQSPSPIPGFADSLSMIRDLLDRGRGIEAENISRALLARVESVRGRDVLEVADVLDLLGRAVRRSSKVK